MLHNKMFKKLKIRRGIAYIEVLVASVILTGYIIPTYGYFAEIVQRQSLVEQYVIAKNIAETKIETERSKIASEMVVGTRNEVVSQLPSGSLTEILTDVDPGRPSLYRYEVRVNWFFPGNNKNISISTLIDPEGY